MASVGEGGEYERRRPELTVLYEAVQRGWPSVQESLPERIREEVRRFLECGLLRYGFRSFVLFFFRITSAVDG